MAERFDISALWGYRDLQFGSPKPMGVTYTVHDRAYLHHAVAVFRSEEFARRPHVDGRRPRSREQALAAAEAECARLNAKYPEGFPA